MLNKLLGKKKKDDYFLEFDDAKGASPETESTETKPEPAPEPPKPEAKQPEAQPESSKEEAPKKSKRTSIKDRKKKEAKPAAKSAPAPAPQPKAQPKKEAATVLFAPDYLAPKPTATRRRPGANMAGFLDMAKQMNRR